MDNIIKATIDKSSKKDRTTIQEGKSSKKKPKLTHSSQTQDDKDEIQDLLWEDDNYKMNYKMTNEINNEMNDTNIGLSTIKEKKKSTYDKNLTLFNLIRQDPMILSECKEVIINSKGYKIHPKYVSKVSGYFVSYFDMQDKMEDTKEIIIENTFTGRVLKDYIIQASIGIMYDDPKYCKIYEDGELTDLLDIFVAMDFLACKKFKADIKEILDNRLAIIFKNSFVKYRWFDYIPNRTKISKLYKDKRFPPPRGTQIQNLFRGLLVDAPDLLDKDYVNPYQFSNDQFIKQNLYQLYDDTYRILSLDPMKWMVKFNDEFVHYILEKHKITKDYGEAILYVLSL